MATTYRDDPIEAAARRIYARVLSQWAIDLLRLRRDGLDVPSERVPEMDLVTPAGAFRQPARADWSLSPATGAIRWKPARKAA